MIRFVNALTQVITAEADLHQQLLDAANAKRQAIIAGDIAKMEAVLNSEYELVEQVEAQEKNRIQIVARLAPMLEITAQPVTMALLLAKIPAEMTGELAAARQRLKDLLEQLRFRTRQNAELLKASLEHVNAFLNMISTAGDVKTYTRRGILDRQAVQLFDRRA